MHGGNFAVAIGVQLRNGEKMNLTITVNLDNTDFKKDDESVDGVNLGRILNTFILNKITCASDGDLTDGYRKTLYDTNGNPVGQLIIKEA